MSPKKASMSFLFFFLVFLTLSFSFSSAEYDSVYDLLKANGIPKGFLPAGITTNDFTFDSTSGKLTVHLPFLKGTKVCKVTRTQYLENVPINSRVEFQTTISATLKYRHLFHIEGITASINITTFPEFSDRKIVEFEVSSDGKRFHYVASPYAASLYRPITDDFDVPQTCEQDSVYDLLKANGIPKGFLPAGITINDFTFDSTSGKLTIHFPFLKGNEFCKVTRTKPALGILIYNTVYFQATISFTLKYQHLTDIEGIAATVYYGVVPLVYDITIVEITVTSGGIRFISSFSYVQSPELPITDDFEVPQTCEAGLAVSPINMMPLFGVGIVDNENHNDNYPLIFYKKAFGRRA